MGQLKQAEDPDWPGDQERIKTKQNKKQKKNNNKKTTTEKRLINGYMSYNYNWVAWDLTYSFGKGKQDGMCKCMLLDFSE